jgi:sterol carrier protein 2
VSVCAHTLVVHTWPSTQLITYEALGLCGVGKAGEYIDRKQNTYGGQHVVNPSGGLISKGHPLGATGLAQCCELTWQVWGPGVCTGWVGRRD